MNVQKIGNGIISGLESATKGAKKITSVVSDAAHRISHKKGMKKEALTAIQHAEGTMKAMDAQSLSARVQATFGEGRNIKKLSSNADFSGQDGVLVKYGKIPSVGSFKPHSYETATKQLIREGIAEGQNASEAVNGARALMSATNMQEVSKSAKESAEFMKKNGVFDGISPDREKALRSKYGAQLDAKKAKAAEIKAAIQENNRVSNETEQALDMLKDTEKFTPNDIEIIHS